MNTFKSQENVSAVDPKRSWVNCDELPQQRKVPKRYDSLEESAKIPTAVDPCDGSSGAPSPSSTLGRPPKPPPPPRGNSQASVTLPRAAKKPTPPVPIRTDASLPRKKKK